MTRSYRHRMQGYDLKGRDGRERHVRGPKRASRGQALGVFPRYIEARPRTLHERAPEAPPQSPPRKGGAAGAAGAGPRSKRGGCMHRTAGTHTFDIRTQGGEREARTQAEKGKGGQQPRRDAHRVTVAVRRWCLTPSLVWALPCPQLHLLHLVAQSRHRRRQK